MVSAFLLAPRAQGHFPELLDRNLDRAERAGVPVRLVVGDFHALEAALAAAASVVDAVLGTGARGAPSGPAGEAIALLASVRAPILSIDIPSGLDCDTGEAHGVFVRARITAALGLLKKGLLAPAAVEWVGRLEVVDIGLPPALLREVLG